MLRPYGGTRYFAAACNALAMNSCSSGFAGDCFLTSAGQLALSAKGLPSPCWLSLQLNRPVPPALGRLRLRFGAEVFPFPFHAVLHLDLLDNVLKQFPVRFLPRPDGPLGIADRPNRLVQLSPLVRENFLLDCKVAARFDSDSNSLRTCFRGMPRNLRTTICSSRAKSWRLYNRQPDWERSLGRNSPSRS